MKNTKEKQANVQIHKNHRARMKDTFLKTGFEGFSEIQKLEFMLFFGVPRQDVNPLAHALLDRYGTLRNVLAANFHDLKKIKGVGDNVATLIKTFNAVCLTHDTSLSSTKLTSSDDAKDYFYNILRHSSVEEFYIVCLNSANQILHTKKINSGTATKVAVEIREITSLALSINASKIIVAHNHPDGHLAFSNDDLHLSLNLIYSCILNSLEFTDHILVTPAGAKSLYQEGYAISLYNLALQKLGVKKTLKVDPSCPYEQYNIIDPEPEKQLDISFYE